MACSIVDSILLSSRKCMNGVSDDGSRTVVEFFSASRKRCKSSESSSISMGSCAKLDNSCACRTSRTSTSMSSSAIAGGRPVVRELSFPVGLSEAYPMPLKSHDLGNSKTRIL